MIVKLLSLWKFVGSTSGHGIRNRCVSAFCNAVLNAHSQFSNTGRVLHLNDFSKLMRSFKKLQIFHVQSSYLKQRTNTNIPHAATSVQTHSLSLSYQTHKVLPTIQQQQLNIGYFCLLKSPSLGDIFTTEQQLFQKTFQLWIKNLFSPLNTSHEPRKLLTKLLLYTSPVQWPTSVHAQWKIFPTCDYFRLKPPTILNRK